MSILSRFLPRRQQAPETRAAGVDIYGSAIAAFGATGSAVTPRTAEALSTALACVNVISSSLASLPVLVFRETAEGRFEVPRSHPVARLLRQPAEGLAWVDFCAWLVGSALLHGNALASIELNARGEPVALRPHSWGQVAPVLVAGKLCFDVDMAPPGTGPRRRFRQDEVLFIRDRSDDGLLGRSVLSRSPATFENASLLEEWSSSMWANGTAPSGMLTVPANISAEGLKRLKSQFEERHVGPANARRVLFADPASTWVPLAGSAEDSEVLASRRFACENIARAFGVPPPLVGVWDHSSFTNSETAGRWMATFTLAPWARRIETAIERTVFGASGDGYSVEIDLSSLMRGDYEARWRANVAAVQAGILSANDVRVAEGWNPRGSATPPPAEPIIG